MCNSCSVAHISTSRACAAKVLVASSTSEWDADAVKSSAYDVYRSIESGYVATYALKSMGERTDPCGTP